MFRARITFILLFWIVFFAGCGNQDENIAEQLPQVVRVSVNNGQELKETTPITIIFTKEMAEVEIDVTGAKGTTTVDGKTATWNPSEVTPGFHTIVISGRDKSGRPLGSYETINFFTKPPLPQNPADAWIKSAERIYGFRET